MTLSLAWVRAGFLVGICALGLVLRSLLFGDVFSASGTVVLGLDDAFYHARRALYSFVNFPAVLHFDPYLAYPDGAGAPAPPLFDWATAVVARLFGNDLRVFEVVAAWVSPVTGALFALPAYAIARSIATPAVGLLAGLLTALLPCGLLLTRLGNFDHHGAVALIAGCWLAASVTHVGRERFSMARCALQGGAALVMLFTWSGSLLYLALAASGQLAAFLVFPACRGMLRALAVGFAAAAVPTSLWLAVTPAALGGPFTDQTLSWLHVIGLLAIAGVALSLEQWEQRRPAAGIVARMLRLLLVTLVIAAPLVALPAVRESLLEGIGFLTKNDPWAGTNPEQLPLFHGTERAALATVRLGWFAYLVPILPLYLGIRIKWSRERSSLVVLLVWILALTALFWTQVRYGTDYTVAGCVALALVLGDLQRVLARWLPAATATVAVGVALAVALHPTYANFHKVGIRYALASLRTDASPGAKGSDRFRKESHFAERVRQATPNPGDFFDASVKPTYGILVPVTMGHLFLYKSHRPTPANNLGNYLDAEKYRLVNAFYEAPDEAAALRAAERLSVRYVVTTPRGKRRWHNVVHATNDSAVRDRSSSGRLRLVEFAESRRGPGSATMRTPYKLFELVEGALLAVGAAPGQKVSAAIEVQVRDQSFRYYARGRADGRGMAYLRVPYANETNEPLRGVTTGAVWQVEVGDQTLRYSVSEGDVREGRTVRPIVTLDLPKES